MSEKITIPVLLLGQDSKGRRAYAVGIRDIDPMARAKQRKVAIGSAIIQKIQQQGSLEKSKKRYDEVMNTIINPGHEYE